MQGGTSGWAERRAAARRPASGERAGQMSAVAGLFAAVFAVAALADWWSRLRDRSDVERWSKPLALIALIAVAVALEPADETVRAWFVAALVASLAGDVFLMFDERWFIAGLASFLVAHLLYVVGFVAADSWVWWRALLALVAMMAVAAIVGRRIVAGAASTAPALRLPVVAYLVVISSMAVAAAAAGNGWAIAGAALFVTSDAILGWNRFVAGARWMSVAIMVTYHLGQAGLVLSLA